MNTESPRLRALLAAGAALVVFGVTIPATASPESPNPNRPGVGEVGNVPDRVPPGQEVQLDEDADSNRGYQCDGNNGAGGGNPAHGTCQPTGGTIGEGDSGGSIGEGDTTGGGDTTGEWSSDS